MRVSTFELRFSSFNRNNLDNLVNSRHQLTADSKMARQERILPLSQLLIWWILMLSVGGHLLLLRRHRILAGGLLLLLQI